VTPERPPEAAGPPRRPPHPVSWRRDAHGGFRRPLPGDFVVESTRPGHAEALEALQRVVFPTLAADQRFTADHYRHHLTLFPEGQFVVTRGDRVVAATTTLRRHVDFDRPEHTFDEIIRGGWLTSHQPGGAWLYGADLGVHPDWRRRGLALALYAARQELVRALGLRGQVTAGMMSGYGAVRDAMRPEDYYQGLRDGAVTDPTLSMQLRAGFEIRALLRGHLRDPVCDDCAVLIVLDAARDLPGADWPADGED
jgi:predicted N-acetyltransferase YhbS